MHTDSMAVKSVVLRGRRVRLEPMAHNHIDDLVAAASEDRSLYQWSPVPGDRAQATAYVETALAWQDSGKALPFVTFQLHDGSKAGTGKDILIGSTRFFDLEQWAWPPVKS